MVEKYNPLQQVVYPELEPGVINKDMINEAIESLHFKGEKGRLQKLNALDYTKVTILRLELKSMIWFHSDIIIQRFKISRSPPNRPSLVSGEPNHSLFEFQ